MVLEGHCPRCGGKLAEGRTSGGQCLRCLIGLGLDSAESESLEDESAAVSLPVIDGFRILRPLGRGGMGAVFLAEEEALGRKVAVKVVSAAFAAARPAEARQRFRREARTLAAVEHPNIVRVYSLGSTADGRDYLAMEYVEGETLADRIERRGRLPPAEALLLARQTVEALAAAWDRGVVHRDIKPSNLFVDANDVVRVGDFGLARPLALGDDDRLTHVGAPLGTPTYTSPEQARGRAVDFRGDVYSLGIVLFEMLAGEPPYSAASPFDLTYQHLHRDLPLARLQGPAASPEIQNFLLWLTAKDPRHRPAAYPELLAALDDLLALAGSASAASPAAAGGLAAPAVAPIGVTFPRGPLVAKRCDRHRQMMAFARHFRENRWRRPGRPQVYLLHGGEEQCHGSLVQRFVHEYVTKTMEAGASVTGGGVLLRRIGWPDGATLGELQAYLVTDLFTELDATYSGLAADAAALARLEKLSLASAVIVEHDIRGAQLDRAGLQLVDWYVNEFWGGFPEDPGAPQFVVFLNLVYSRSRRARWRLWPSTPSLRRRQLGRRLETIFAARSGGVPRLVLNELGPVTLDHVKQWFRLNAVFESDKERYETAERLFTTEQGATVDSLPMADVELALSRIHADFLKRKGLYP